MLRSFWFAFAMASSIWHIQIIRLIRIEFVGCIWLHVCLSPLFLPYISGFFLWWCTGVVFDTLGLLWTLHRIGRQNPSSLSVYNWAILYLQQCAIATDKSLISWFPVAGVGLVDDHHVWRFVWSMVKYGKSSRVWHGCSITIVGTRPRFGLACTENKAPIIDYRIHK